MGKMIAIPVEKFSWRTRTDIVDWLIEEYGKPSLTTWYCDIHPLMEDIVCNEEIAVIFLLKWGNLPS